MQIVIDISEKYKKLLDSGEADGSIRKSILLAVVNGTPLPKGHGRLIDADKLWNAAYHDLDCDFYEAFNLADTIIEADKAESEDKE